MKKNGKNRNRNPFCNFCKDTRGRKIPMRKKPKHKEGEKRFFCPKCRQER